MPTACTRSGGSVVDDVNNQDGIGSRFFFVENGVSGSIINLPPPVAAEAPETTPETTMERSARPRPQRGAVPQVMTAQELERLVIALPEGHWTGAHVINGGLQPLPVGSTLDNASGAFYWQPGPGFLGRHELLFTSADGAVHGITVNIEPKSFDQSVGAVARSSASSFVIIRGDAGAVGIKPRRGLWMSRSRAACGGGRMYRGWKVRF